MSNIYRNLTELIGKTPLKELNRYRRDHKLGARILAKIESFNPAGSVKDRISLAMLNEAECAGKLTQDTTIIEATSGNT